MIRMSDAGVLGVAEIGADTGTAQLPVSDGGQGAASGWQQRAWRQVAERDGSARFLYGVRTTGIFCRTSCPSRRPARHNVVFFRHAGEAMTAGFRACLRCRPAGLPAEAAAVSTICAYLKTHFDRKVTLAELGQLVSASPFTVQRLVQRVLGISPLEYQRELRAAALRAGLSDRIGHGIKIGGIVMGSTGAGIAGMGITDAIYDAGYSSASRVYENSTERLGMSPGRYRARGVGERIRFATAECALGFVLVATTERGICSIALGDSAEVLEAHLRGQFPAACISSGGFESGDGGDSQSSDLEAGDLKAGDLEAADLEAGNLRLPDTRLADGLRQVLSQLTEHPAVLDLPIDVRATAFQTRVWQALKAIPRGETRSYSEIARGLGTPRAVRAVARACASNPVAIVVPCHRVVGIGGKLSGYRWGVERKRRLLEMEQG